MTKRPQKSYVAPLVGAWIEIIISKAMKKADEVAPLVGAWIEIPWVGAPDLLDIVAPLVGAWIEISIAPLEPDANMSLLSWERGLKYIILFGAHRVTLSLLSWERGLK